jgi:hypothetical protein
MNPSPSEPTETPTERLYLIIGTEDGIQSSIWPESKLHHGVLSALFDEPLDASQEEAEYWEEQLRNDNNWSWDRGHFHQGIGEVAHLDIYRITDRSFLTNTPSPKLQRTGEAKERIEEMAKSLFAIFSDVDISWWIHITATERGKWTRVAKVVLRQKEELSAHYESREAQLRERLAEAKRVIAALPYVTNPKEVSEGFLDNATPAMKTPEQ